MIGESGVQRDELRDREICNIVVKNPDSGGWREKMGKHENENGDPIKIQNKGVGYI